MLLTFLLQLGAEALLAKCQPTHETRKGMNVVEQAYADMHIRGTGELWLPAPLAAPHEGPAAPARRGSLLSLLSMPFWNTGAKIKTNFLHWWTIVWDNETLGDCVLSLLSLRITRL